MRNLYDVLGVSKTADQAAIKKAYKKLARENHPDLNKEAAAAERFKEISAAYEVLGDEEKRSMYDEFGEASLQAGFDTERARAWKAAGGGPGFGGGGMPGGFNVDDLFGSIFGANQTRTRRGPQRAKGTDIESTLKVSFLDAIRGSEQLVQVRRPAQCGSCDGAGGTGRSTCGGCNGSGRVSMQQFGMSAIVACDQCGGTGMVFSSECNTCAGTGRGMSQERLKVKIPAGVENHQTIRLRGKGGEGRHGGPPGDLLLNIEVRGHTSLRRQGHNLEMDVPITFSESILGGSVEIPTPLGKAVRVKVPPGAKNGQRLRLKGKGIDGKGDLYLILRPTPPETSEEAEQAATELAALYQEDVRKELVF